MTDRKKLDERKNLLKEQLDKMKAEKKVKDKEAEEQKKAKEEFRMKKKLKNHHHQQENNHHQHGHMEADDDGQPIDDQDTDGDALSPQKRPLNNNNNDVATVFLIDTSEVGPGHDDADQAVEVDEVCRSFQIFSPLFFTVS